MSLPHRACAGRCVVTQARRTEIALVEETLRGEWPRLVRLCARLSGDGQAAEDLAQETLVEAWRNLHKVYDPDGLSPWLSAIAHNVCRRWRRRQKNDADHLAQATASMTSIVREDDTWPADDTDVHIELERDELAIKLRLHRGRLALRRVLHTRLREEMVEYGLAPVEGAVWSTTRLWCPQCGQQHFTARFSQREGLLLLRCPRCDDEPGAMFLRTDWPALLNGVAGVKAALSRLMRWADPYYRAARRPVRIVAAPLGSSLSGRRTRPPLRVSRARSAMTASTARQRQAGRSATNRSTGSCCSTRRANGFSARTKGCVSSPSAWSRPMGVRLWCVATRAWTDTNASPASSRSTRTRCSTFV